jgi:hypothetical protein
MPLAITKIFLTNEIGRKRKVLSVGVTLRRISKMSISRWRSCEFHVCITMTGTTQLTNVNIQIAVFWVVTPCSAAIGYRRFGGPCCSHLRKIGSAWSMVIFQKASTIITTVMKAPNLACKFKCKVLIYFKALSVNVNMKMSK